MGNTVTKEAGATIQSSKYSGMEQSNICENDNTDRTQWHLCKQDLVHKIHRSKRSSKSHKKVMEGYEMIADPTETVDGGFLFPQGVYTGAQDFKVSVVRELIIRRKLAPFYKGLDGIDSSCTDEQLLSALNTNTNSVVSDSHETESATTVNSSDTDASISTNTTLQSENIKINNEEQIWLYRNVTECPICFLDYPRLNNTSCCGYDICTECFVQIKRNPPHPPHNAEQTGDVLELLSEPSACPFCARSDFGVTFEAPPFEWGISSTVDPLPRNQKSTSIVKIDECSLTSPTGPFKVTIDMIRPDWEDKLISARAKLARKSAAAQALHRSAILPSTNIHASSTPETKHSKQHKSRSVLPDIRFSKNKPKTLTEADVQNANSYSEVLESARGMDRAQLRALEKLMLDEAIKASMAQT